MNLVVKKIDQIIEDNSLLKHPFYQMWSDGKLEFESLVGYAKEYYQLVKEVPNFMKPIIEMTPSESKSELIGNMEEETQHIEHSYDSATGGDSCRFDESRTDSGGGADWSRGSSILWRCRH